MLRISPLSPAGVGIGYERCHPTRDARTEQQDEDEYGVGHRPGPPGPSGLRTADAGDHVVVRQSDEYVGGLPEHDGGGQTYVRAEFLCVGFQLGYHFFSLKIIKGCKGTDFITGMHGKKSFPQIFSRYFPEKWRAFGEMRKFTR